MGDRKLSWGHKKADDLFKQYRRWITSNPQSLVEVEGIVKWSSYLLAGRFGHSSLLCELLYSTSRLFELFNDALLQSKLPHLSMQQENKIKMLLSVLEGVEVVVEVGASQFWGDTGKWAVVAIIQLVKTIWRLVLVLQERVRFVASPALPHQDRSALLAPAPPPAPADGSSLLPHTGHIMKPLHHTPPPHMRSFLPTPALIPAPNTTSHAPRSNKQLCAEMLHVMRPLTHLCSLRLFGQQSWLPAVLALGMDVSSAHLHRGALLSPCERAELMRRNRSVLLYLLRFPAYQRVTEHRLRALLNTVAGTVPFTSTICGSLMRYATHWNSIYCHSWSN